MICFIWHVSTEARYELIRTSSQTFGCKFQNVILELITEAWAIDMQANAVINAV